MSNASTEELELKEALKAKCDSNGCETNPKQAAEIFHKLGLIYMKRSHDKLSLIQSAGLLKAALIREHDNAGQIRRDMQELCALVLEEASAKNSGADLIEVSLKVAEHVEKMRKEAKKDLQKTKIIPETLDDENLMQMETQKIIDIQNIQEKVTTNYTSIMHKLSNRCLGILGDPPCEFSVVGLGSLARREITPYSDFEHIIVLEEEAKHNPEYFEYFRWFSVIFEIILINLGETVLPSLDISCLNDSYTGDPRDFWFYDNYTPCGISFDGRKPHACKSPLGTSKRTSKKDCTLELIKPISEMVKYLDSDEDIKNGYHLADMLTTTCFVYGNDRVYDDFYSEVQNKVKWQRSNDKTYFKRLEALLEEDMKSFDTAMDVAASMAQCKINIKRFLYRSTTIYLSTLGKYHGVEYSSCFEIINQLHRSGIINKDAEHRLKLAVAIACEARLKIYIKNKCQKDLVKHENILQDNQNLKSEKEEISEIVGVIGEHSLVHYFTIAMVLQDYMKSFDQLEFGIDDNLMAIIYCWNLGFYQLGVFKGKRFIKKIDISKKNSRTIKVETFCWTAFCLLEYYRDSDRLMEEFKNLFNHLVSSTNRERFNYYLECLNVINECSETIKLMFVDMQSEERTETCLDAASQGLMIPIPKTKQSVDFMKFSNNFTFSNNLDPESEQFFVSIMKNIFIGDVEDLDLSTNVKKLEFGFRMFPLWLFFETGPNIMYKLKPLVCKLVSDITGSNEEYWENLFQMSKLSFSVLKNFEPKLTASDDRDCLIMESLKSFSNITDASFLTNMSGNDIKNAMTSSLGLDVDASVSASTIFGGESRVGKRISEIVSFVQEFNDCLQKLEQEIRNKIALFELVDESLD